jgi:hypothetical protein
MFDLGTDGGLGDVNPIGSGGEATLLGDCLDVLQMTEFQLIVIAHGGPRCSVVRWTLRVTGRAVKLSSSPIFHKEYRVRQLDMIAVVVWLSPEAMVPSV